MYIYMCIYMHIYIYICVYIYIYIYIHIHTYVNIFDAQAQQTIAYFYFNVEITTRNLLQFSYFKLK